MYNFKHTFKRLVVTTLKLTVVTGCFYFLYRKLAVDNAVSYASFYSSISVIFDTGFLLVGTILSLSVINWSLEILKWRVLVNTRQSICFKTAAKQCLSALTLSLLTPNRVGDYLAKALYYSKKQTKTIVILNAIGHFAQLFITLIFGVFGLLYLYFNFGFGISINLLFLWTCVGLILLIILIIRSKFYTYRIQQFCSVTTTVLPFKILMVSLLRYLVFSHQFYLLMLIFNLQVAYLPSMMGVFSMYLLASVVPTFSFLDWAIKGSTAVFVFSNFKIDSLPILEISLLMWVLNFALPALVGSVFVLQYKPPKIIPTCL